jgi:hypothetical protein
MKKSCEDEKEMRPVSTSPRFDVPLATSIVLAVIPAAALLADAGAAQPLRSDADTAAIDKACFEVWKMLSFSQGGHREYVRNRETTKRGIPERQRSEAELREGAVRHLRREWQSIWEARRKDLSLDEQPLLYHALSRHSHSQEILIGQARMAGIAPDEIRPAPDSRDAREAFLIATVNSPPEREVALLRAILCPPSLPNAWPPVIRYAATFPEPRFPPDMPLEMRLVTAEQWRWLCTEFDPQLASALVDFVTSPEGKSSAIGVAYALFVHDGRVVVLISPADAHRLLTKSPPGAIETVMGMWKAFSFENSHLQSLKTAVFEADVPASVQEAVAAAMIGDRKFVGMVFDLPSDSRSERMRKAVLESYRRQQKALPREIAWDRLAGDARFSAETRRLISEVLTAEAARRNTARSGYKNLWGADDDEYDSDRAQRMAPSVNVAYISEQLKRLERGEIQMTPENREYLETILLSYRAGRAQSDLKAFARAVKRYAVSNGGRLPASKRNVIGLPEDVALDSILYFPVGSRPLPESQVPFVIAIASNLSDEKGPQFGSFALMSDGQITRTGQGKLFADFWRRSNANRRALGLPEVADTELGAIRAWLVAQAQPHTQPTQPSPTTHPGGATQPTSAPRPSSQPGPRR